MTKIYNLSEKTGVFGDYFAHRIRNYLRTNFNAYCLEPNRKPHTHHVATMSTGFADISIYCQRRNVFLEIHGDHKQVKDFEKNVVNKFIEDYAKNTD